MTDAILHNSVDATVHSHICLGRGYSLRHYTFMKHLEIKTLVEHCRQGMDRVSSRGMPDIKGISLQLLVKAVWPYIYVT